jgi:hypothetical protein
VEDDQDSEGTPFEPGQIWSYKTRPGEEDSVVIIRAIQEREDGGAIFHVSIEGVDIVHDGHKEIASIAHCPIYSEAFEESVEEMIGDVRWPEDFCEGYETWEQNKGGVFAQDLASVISMIAGSAPGKHDNDES